MIKRNTDAGKKHVIDRKLLAFMLGIWMICSMLLFNSVPGKVWGAGYYRLPSGTNEKLIEQAATFLGYPYPKTGKEPNIKLTTGQAMDGIMLIQLAVLKAGYANIPNSTLAWSKQINEKSLNITYDGQQIETFYFTTVSELQKAKNDPKYEGCLLVLTTPTMEEELTKAGALDPGTLLIRYGTGDFMCDASMVVGTVEPKGVLTPEDFKGQSLFLDAQYVWNTYSHYYNTITYYAQVYREFSYLFDIAKSAQGICDMTYLMMPFDRGKMKMVGNYLFDGKIKKEYQRLSYLTNITVNGMPDTTCELIDKMHEKSTENVLKYSVEERFHYLILSQQSSGTVYNPRVLSDGKAYPGVGDTSVWKIEALSQKTGVAITNNIHETDTIGACLVYFNETAPQRYGTFSMMEYDATDGTLLTGSKYILTDKEEVAKAYAKGAGNKKVLDTITLSDDVSTSFSVLTFGTATTKTFYVAQRKTEKAWAKNEGYWKVTLQGGTKEDGTDSKVLDIKYCYNTDSDIWAEEPLTTNAEDGGFFKGYIYAPDGWLVVPRRPNYYFSMDLVLSDPVKNYTPSFVVGTGFDTQTGELLDKLGEPVILGSEKVNLISSYKSNSLSDIMTFYLKEIADREGLTTEGVYKVTLKGAKAKEDGQGTTITELVYYNDQTLLEGVNIEISDPLTLSLTSAFASFNLLPFTDISYGTWQYTIVEFVYNRGIIEGTTKTEFSPDEKMTRGQFITLLWGMEESPKAEYDGCFEDVSSDKFYAQAVQWGYENELIARDTDKFNPDSTITREELVTFLYQYAVYKDFDVSVNSETSYLEKEDSETISSFAIKSMNWAYENKLIAAEGKFNAKSSCTRIESAEILMRFIQCYME